MIWLFRTDKIGDTVVSLPLDQLIPAGETVRWFLSSQTLFLAKNSQPNREARELPAFWDLVRIAREEKPNAAIVLQSHWWVSLALWLGGVPIRSGRKSQWHSFLFFNRGVRQSRSLSEKHECEYGLELVRAALPEISAESVPPQLFLKGAGRSAALEKWNLQPLNYYVAHPGMAGSARNWPQGHYSLLIEELVKTSTVVITGTEADRPFLTELEPQWKNHPKVRWTVGAVKLEDLLIILSRASAVVAPSTGILHLAASLQTPAVGIFSPVRVHHPKRWGPRGRSTHVHLPEVSCPAATQCLGTQCPSWDCMLTITPEAVLASLHSLGRKAST